ncbi:manganese efflux pump MntP family protein, partial [Candidatus Bathyarchaeota archaeon]|nr:manganese efflux pump MntP family protein [Candidatus Bathyarchaeota archaeon]
LGLAMDSFSVSITRGFTTKTRTSIEAIRTGFFFGLFQALMPVAGWLVGLSIINLISGFDHWIAFGLLVFIGIRMIYESITKESKQIVSSSSFKILIIMSIATSIDALVVGLSLSFLETSIATTVITIGIITFSLSVLGVYLGKKFGSYFEKIGILGGIILIIIGVRILIEHLRILI